MSVLAINSASVLALQKTTQAQGAPPANANANPIGANTAHTKDSDGDYDASPSSPAALSSSAVLTALSALKAAG